MFVGVALELLKSAIEKAGYPDKIIIGMDVAASEFYRSGKYDLDFKSPDDPSRHISGEKLGDLYRSFIKNYPGTQVQQMIKAERPQAPPQADPTPGRAPDPRPAGAMSEFLKQAQSSSQTGPGQSSGPLAGVGLLGPLVAS